MDAQEIERKFLATTLPPLAGLTPLRDERGYLIRIPGVVLRFQRRGTRYELERMVDSGALSRRQQKWEISAPEYDSLARIAPASIVRDSYLLQARDPQITLKLYSGRHSGLARIEVEFSSVAAARAFNPPHWYGPEITDSPLGSDGRLLDLTAEQFATLLTAAGGRPG